LEEAEAGYVSGLFGAILEWHGPYDGPFPLCQEWHGSSSAVVTGLGPFPPDCIYEIDVETIQEAERLYDQWRYLVEQEKARRLQEEEPHLTGQTLMVLEGKCAINEYDDQLGIDVGGSDITAKIIETFVDWSDRDRLDGFTFGPVRITVELLDAPQ